MTSVARVNERSTSSLRPDIEGLRALAILLVIACHCNISWCRGGFLGVDIFFVLSGYLITGLLSAELRTTSRLNLTAFLARRARRLFPACAVVLIATMAASLVILPPQQVEATGRAAGAAALYVSNVFFDANAADYFAASVEMSPFLHTWSLGVEEQFYLMWPLLVLVAGPARLRRALCVMGVAIALSFAICLYLTRHAPTFAFYELPSRAWEFAAGGLLALLPCPTGARAASAARAGGVIGALIILTASWLVRGSDGFPGWIALLPVCATLALLLAGSVSPQRGVSRLLSIAPLQFIGARSYSWYLWHWPCVAFVALLAPATGSLGLIGATAIGLCLASLTYHYVEGPIRTSAYLRARSGTTLRLAAALAGLTLATGWLVIVVSQRMTENSGMQSVHVAESTPPGISTRDCVGQGVSTRVQTCVFGEAGAKTLVLFGDSHALQWFGAFHAMAAQRGWRLVTALKVACPASYINPHHMQPGTDLCDEWRNRAIDTIIALHPAVIVISSYTGATLRGFGREEPISPEALRTGTRRILQALRPSGAVVVVLRDSPLPPFSVPACVARRVLHLLNAPSTCDFDASARNDSAFDAQKAAASGLEGVYFLDLNDVLCPETLCPAVIHGMIVYRDDNHLAASFTNSLATDVNRRLFLLLGALPQFAKNDESGHLQLSVTAPASP